MSVKNIKIAATSIFILLALLALHLYVEDSLSNFTKELQQDTLSISSTENIEPVFYQLHASKEADKKPLKVKKNKIYTLELGLTSSLTEAKNKVVEFKKLHINAYYTPLRQHGKTYYRLRFGVFENKTEAIYSKKLLQSKKINAKLKAL